ncbi:type VI secretion system Vgr family protein [Roseomonas sp. WA12]
MTDSVQHNSKIQIDTALERDEFLAVGVVGTEAISRPFLYTITMLSKNFHVTADRMLGRMIGLRIKRSKDEYRGYHGIVHAFTGGELHPKRKEFRSYTAKVVPWLALLDQGTGYRIFQDRDVLQIIDAVLKDSIGNIFAGANQSLYYSIRVESSAKYPPLQHCVQYDETDFNFISRLMEQHGLHYFFQQTDVSHKMIIVDGPPYQVCPDSPFAFVPSPDARGIVRSWTHSFTPQLRSFTYRDREYRRNPALAEKTEKTIIPEVAASTQGDHFEHPGAFAVLSDPSNASAYGASLVRIRMQEEETRFEAFSGNSVRVALAAGTRLKIIGVDEQSSDERITTEEEREYLITSVTFSVTEESYTGDKAGEIVLRILKETLLAGAESGAGALSEPAKAHLPDVNKTINSLPGIVSILGVFGGGAASAAAGLLADLASPILGDIPIIGPFLKKAPKPPAYTNSFTGVPILQGRQYRSPSISPKPRVLGPQTAIVHGPTIGDVWSDELGRVLLKFDWDTTQKGDKGGETTSCWVRVVQGSAGPRLGMQYLPRVGDEVVVEFIDGDPDRPLVTGRVYSAAHKPPFELTKYRLQSGIKTRSVPLEEGDKDRYHMLRFDDSNGKEQLLLRSQKRMDVRAFGSLFETTGGNRHEIVGFKDPDSDKQGGDYDITVGNDYQLHINGGHYQRIEKDRNLTVVGKTVMDLQSDATVMVKGTAALNAAKIVLEAKQKISLKVGGNAIIIDPSGVTIIGTVVKINSGGAGEETPDASIEDPEDAAASDTGEPGWLERHKGGPGGGRKRRGLKSQHAIAPPRPGESAAMTALRNRLNQTTSGRNAMNVYDRNNVIPVVGVPGGGTFYTPPYSNGLGNTVTLDPTSSVPASDFVHEMNHADAPNSGLTPDINTVSRQDYINRMLAEEAHGEVLGQEAHNELAAIGDPEAGSRNVFTGPVYDAASQAGQASYRAAHPDATESDVVEAGRAAGEQAMLNSFQSGNVPTSNSGQPYPAYYGFEWDKVHPPARP